MPARIAHPESVVIANGGSLSPAIGCGNMINGAVEIVTPFTSAAVITFQGSDDGTTYYDVYDPAGTEVTIPSHATHTGRAYELPAAVLNFRFIKIRSGTSAAPVTQSPGAAGTTVTVILKN